MLTKYGILTIVDLKQLSPEQIHLGIEIEAHIRWLNRLQRQAQSDWELAWSRVRTKENPYPEDKVIRPIAYKIYSDRTKLQLLKDFLEAIQRSEGEIRWTAAQVAAERTRKQMLQDWLGAEQETHRLGKAWFPVPIRQSRKKSS